MEAQEAAILPQLATLSGARSVILPKAAPVLSRGERTPIDWNAVCTCMTWTSLIVRGNVCSAFDKITLRNPLPALCATAYEFWSGRCRSDPETEPPRGYSIAVQRFWLHEPRLEHRLLSLVPLLKILLGTANFEAPTLHFKLISSYSITTRDLRE